MTEPYHRRLTNSSDLLDILKHRHRAARKGSDTMGDPVNSFEIMGIDLKKLGSFYQQAFDWKLGSPQPAYTMAYPKEDLPVAGVLFQARPGQAAHAMFYVQVGDIDAKLAQIQKLGGKT